MIAVRMLAVAAAIIAAVGALAASVAGRPDPTAAERFLDRYVDASGRVVRRDQGGDTVSEGQAYAMIVAAETGDRATFENVWGWTRRNLQRDDGLLAWHWEQGRVVDEQPASDADLDAAYALLVAARRFGAEEYRLEATRIAAAIRAEETVEVAGKRYLIPGPWARPGPPHRYNPSYVSPLALAALGWDDIAVPAFQGPPPDWAEVEGDGTIKARERYGYDAARLPLRLAASPSPQHRALAANLWEALDGHPFTDEHPVGMLAAAAAAEAAGLDREASRLADRAADHDEHHPSYYGAAWLALAEVWLDL